MTNDLGERVARALVESDTFGDKEGAEALLKNPDYMQTINRLASAAIAIVLEEAAQCAEAGHALEFTKEAAEYAKGYLAACDQIAAAIRALSNGSGSAS